MQVLFIFTLLCCSLVAMGLLWMALLWRKILHTKNTPASPATTKRLYSLRIYIWCVGGVSMAIGVFTAGMFLGLGEVILYLPIAAALPCFFMAEKIRRARASCQELSAQEHGEHQEIYTLWGKDFEQISYAPASTYAEKNTLEMQALGNDMYMTKSQHITGTYKDATFEQYDICLPDYFQGRSIVFTFPVSFKDKFFVIHRDFPCSQLLTYAGVWQKGASAQEEFNAIYAIFTKDMDALKQSLSPQIQKAIMHMQNECALPQSYYITENTLYVLMPLADAEITSDMEKQVSLIKDFMEYISE